MIRIGVLGLQGDVSEHVEALRKALSEARLEGEVVIVKEPDQISKLSALVIPGGESTVIGRLMERFGLLERVREAAKAGMPIMGTCAGMVLLAKEVYDARVGKVDQPLLGLMDVRVVRNAFGRQRESFEVDLAIPKIGEKPFRAVFIRAPVVERLLSPEVEVLAEYQGKIVAVRQGKLLALSFHPELVEDTRIYRYFFGLFA